MRRSSQRVSLPLLLCLVGCGVDVEPTPSLLADATERWEFEGTAFEPSKVERVLTGQDLASWSFDGERRVEGEKLFLTTGPDAVLASREGFSLEGALFEELEVVVDSGDTRGTAFRLEWSHADGSKDQTVVRNHATGRVVLSLDLTALPGWGGTVTSFAYVPITGGLTTTTCMESLAFRGPFGDLVGRVGGSGSAFVDQEFRTGVRSAVPSRNRIRIVPPRGARLHLGLALIGAGSSEATLGVRVEDDGEEHGLLAVPIRGGAPWQDHSVSLEAWSGRTIDLTFFAEGAPGTVAVFSEPILRGSGDQVRPDVFVYLTDTLRRDALRVYDPSGTGPRIDEFARESIVFEEAFAPSNWTKPSVASLMTSTWPAVHGVPLRTRVVPEDLETLAEQLRAEGYRTASFVTNPLAAHATGLERGFSVVHDAMRMAGSDPRRSLPPRTLAWIETHAGEPLFVYVHTAEPHDPYEAPVEFPVDTDYEGPVGGANFHRQDVTPDAVRHVHALYRAEVAFADSVFGGFLDGLRSLGRFDSSFVVFTSDHGEAFQEHGRWRHGAGLFDHQTAVPLLLHLPGGSQGGTRRSELVGLIDVMPTLLAGVDAPGSSGLRGRSLLTPGQGTGALGLPGILSEASGSARSEGRLREWSYRTDRWKVILTEDTQAETLEVLSFDLLADPEEQTPLAEPYPEPVRELLHRLHRWREDTSVGAALGHDGKQDLGYLREMEALGYTGDD